MNCLKFILIALCLGICTAYGQAQEKYSTVRVFVPPQERNNVIGLLEIDHFYPEADAIVSEISAQALTKLRKSGLQYKVLVDDVAKKLHDENNQYFSSRGKPSDPFAQGLALTQTGGTVNNIIKTPAAFQVKSTFGGYYSYAEMTTAIDNLVAAYPALVQKINLGLSAQSRTIWAVKISDNVATDETGEPEILYTGLQHAREAIGGSSLIFFMQYLAENYATDSRIKDLVDNREFFIVPCVNPDGWEYNRSTNPNGGGGWRKNRRKVGGTTKSPIYGVDLNRNYSVDWGNCAGTTTSCGSSTLSSDTYYGPSAFSEPETKAIRTLVTSRRFVASIDQHCYGPYYSVPFGRPSLHTMLPLDQKFYTAVPAAMGLYNGMRAGNSPQSVGYEVAGGIKDWLLMGDIGLGTKGKVYGMTGEGGSGGGTSGTYGSFWAPASQIVNLSKGMCFQNLQLAYAAGSYVDVQDLSDISTTATTGVFDFKLTRIGLEDKPVTVSLIPMQNIQTVGTPITVASLPNYNDTYTGSISYDLDPAIANGQPVRFAWKIETGGYTYYDTVTKFYNPTQLFYDDMEGSLVTTNWTVTGSWNYATTTAYAGVKSLTESPSGNYAASITATATCKTIFNLSDATAAYLTFWTKHRAENFRDKLQVKVSTNGTTWTAVPGTTTLQEPGTLDGSTINGQPSLTGIRENWTRELFDLSAYKGNANVSLRLEFTSDANTTGFAFQVDDGFSIDNLKVVKATAAPAAAVTFARPSAQLLEDALNTNAAVYPNPVRDRFSVQVPSRQAEAVELLVTDLQGKVVYRSTRSVGAGITSLAVHAQQWPAQTYILKVLSRKGEVLLTQKIVKL